MLKQIVISALTGRLQQRVHRLRRGLTLGARGVVLDAENRVLLVRHTYSPGWLFPGGGVEYGETAELALARELLEEAAITYEGRPTLFGFYSNHARFPGDHLALYVIRKFRQGAWRPSAEIADAQFFAPGELPPDTTPATRRRLAEVAEGRAPDWHW
jgi:ADP-ribose pyrophosphatase YjhB (NUDIX family)